MCMAVDPGAIDAALSAAVGDDPALIAELRAAFRDSARRGLAAIESAQDDAAWQAAASFSVTTHSASASSRRTCRSQSERQA